MPLLVKMELVKDGVTKTADVHPTNVDGALGAGWREVKGGKPVSADSGETETVETPTPKKKAVKKKKT